MESESFATYSVRGRAIVISGPFIEDIVLDEENLRNSIENVRRNRAHYATEKAWLTHLEMFEGALQFALLSNIV